MRRSLFAALRAVACISLSALSILHIAWGLGSAWPARDRAALAEAIGGFSEVPGIVACLVIAKCLALAACCVAGVPRSMPRTTRAGSAAVALVLGARAVAGWAGWMPHARRSTTFAALDRRLYSPVCSALAIASAAGATPGVH